MVSTGQDIEKYYGSEASRPTLVRYRLASVPNAAGLKTSGRNSDANLPKAETLLRIETDFVGDLPTINPKYATRKARYVYNIFNQGKISDFHAPSFQAKGIFLVLVLRCHCENRPRDAGSKNMDAR